MSSPCIPDAPEPLPPPQYRFASRSASGRFSYIMQPADKASGAGEPEARGRRELRRHTRHGSGASDSARKFNRYFLIPLMVVGLLSLVGYISFKPVREELRAWRSVGVVAEAEAALRGGNPPLALRKIEVALQLAPEKAEVHKAAAQIHVAVGSPESILHWQWVLGAANATTEDHLAFVDACLMFQRADLAFDELNRLEPSIAKSPEFLRRVVRYLILVADYASAVPYAREAQTANPRDEGFEYLLGFCLLMSNRTDWVEEGRRLLTSIGLASGSQQMAAVNSLRLTGTLSLVQGRQLARALERRADLSFEDRLTIAGLRLGNDFVERERSVTAVFEESPPSDDKERTAYALWCLQMQTPRPAKTFLMSLKTTNAALQEIRLDAAALDRDWAAVATLIEQDRKQLSSVQIACVEAWRVAAQESPAMAIGAFTAAIGLAASGKGAVGWSQLMTVAQWAERSRLPEVAITALEPLLAARTSVPWAARSILRLGQPLDRAEPCYQTLRALRQYAPADRSVLEAFSYHALLLSRDLADAGKIAEDLASRPDAGPAQKLMAAFARVRLGKAAEALDLIDQTGLDPKTLTPRLEMMAVVVRHAAGQRSSARQEAKAIPRGILKVEERALLDSLD